MNNNNPYDLIAWARISDQWKDAIHKNAKGLSLGQLFTLLRDAESASPSADIRDIIKAAKGPENLNTMVRLEKLETSLYNLRMTVQELQAMVSDLSKSKLIRERIPINVTNTTESILESLKTNQLWSGIATKFAAELQNDGISVASPNVVNIVKSFISSLRDAKTPFPMDNITDCTLKANDCSGMFDVDYKNGVLSVTVNSTAIQNALPNDPCVYKWIHILQELLYLILKQSGNYGGTFEEFRSTKLPAGQSFLGGGYMRQLY